MTSDQESSPTSHVRILVKIVLLGFLFSLFFHHYIAVFLKSTSIPNTFLFLANDAGNDFFNLLQTVKDGNPYGWAVSVYFPFAYALLWLLSCLPKYFAFLALSSIWVGILFYFLKDTLLRSGVSRGQSSLYALILVFLSYPVLFCLDRGNLEGIILALLLGFLYFFKRERYGTSAIFLAFAAAIKGYPALFGFLFIKTGRYREACLSALLCICLYAVTIHFFPGGIIGATKTLLSNQRAFSQSYGLTDVSIPYGLSLFSIVKLSGASALAWSKFYNSIGLIAMLVLCTLASIRQIPLWRSIYLITAGLLLIPQVSFDYKLIGLFLPLACLIEEKATHFELYIFGLLLIPKAYFYIHGQATLGIILNPILLLVLLIKVIWDIRNEIKTIAYHYISE